MGVGSSIDGKKQGTWTWFYPEGPKNATENYKDDLLDGPSVHFYKNGKKKQEEHWEEGVLTGPAKYFYDTGILKREGNYDPYGYSGFWKNYHENGVIKSQGNYFQGMLKGKWEFFDEGSHLVKTNTYPDEGSADPNTFYLTYFGKNGNVLMEGEMHNGQKKGTWIFYKSNGKEKERIDY